jgi:hypothetical protein
MIGFSGPLYNSWLHLTNHYHTQAGVLNHVASNGGGPSGSGLTSLQVGDHPTPTSYSRCSLHSLGSESELLYTWPVGRLNCYWPSPAQAFLASGLVETFDQDFCYLLDLYMFRNGGLLFDEGRGRSLSGGATFVSPCFSTSISALSQRPGPYGHCAPFVTPLF